MKFFSRSVVAALLLAAVAAPAAAQAPEQRTTITFTPGVATVGGDTETALSGSIGYRFTDRLSFEGDFTWIDAAAGGFGGRQFGIDSPIIGGVTGILTDFVQFGSPTTRPGGGGGGRGVPSFNISNLAPTLIGSIGAGDLRAEASGQTMIGTLGVRFEPMVQTARFRPYVSAGLGLNHTEQDFNFAATTATTRATTGATTALRAFDDSVSRSGLAFSAGGGANIRLFSSFWANVDTKYFRLSEDRNVMRLGGGIGFRF